MAGEELITFQNMLIFVAFLAVVVILYKAFNILLRGILIAAAAFSFPWVVSYLGLPFHIIPTIDTGIAFALVGIGLFLAYEFFHFLVFLLRLLTWPIRTLLRRRK